MSAAFARLRASEGGAGVNWDGFFIRKVTYGSGRVAYEVGRSPFGEALATFDTENEARMHIAYRMDQTILHQEIIAP